MSRLWRNSPLVLMLALTGSIWTTIAPAAPQTISSSRTNNAWEIEPFELRGLDGINHSLSEWRGKVILLNFWAAWCGPCQYEIPELVHAQQQYGARGLQIVGVGIDEEGKLRNVAKSLDINYPVLISTQEKSSGLLRHWGNPQQLVPHTVVIARNGEIAYIHRGQLDKESFENYVKPLIEQ